MDGQCRRGKIDGKNRMRERAGRLNPDVSRSLQESVLAKVTQVWDQRDQDQERRQ